MTPALDRFNALEAVTVAGDGRYMTLLLYILLRRVKSVGKSSGIEGRKISAVT